MYGLKSAGAAYRNNFASCLRHFDYEPCKADPDVWFREVIKADGTRYYEYVLVYMDDVLAIGKKPCETLIRIKSISS